MRKLPLILLTLSAVANVVLIALVVQERADRKPGSRLPVKFIPTARSAAFDSTTDSNLAAPETAALRHARELLATEDLPTLVARLRTAGFSSMDIRGIVSARLAEIYGAARVAATEHLEVVPYWRSSMTFPRDPEAGAEVRRLFREQNQMLKQLLGPDYRATDEWSEMLHDRQYSYLPSDKVERLTNLLDDYKDLQQSVFEVTRGVMTADDRAKIELIEKERRADLETLLTSEELEAYDMHTSNTANQLRFQLTAFEPNEEEYQAIYRLTKAASPDDQTLNHMGPFAVGPNPVQAEPTALQKQIEAALGPERAAVYRMTTNPDYIQLHRFAERFDLPDSTVAAAYETSQSIRQRAQAILTDSSLPPDTRADQLLAITNEAEAQLQAQLGAEVYNAYQSRSGQWLKNYQNQAEALRNQGK